MFEKVLPEKAEAQKVGAVEQTLKSQARLKPVSWGAGDVRESPTHSNVWQARGRRSHLPHPKLTYLPHSQRRLSLHFQHRESTGPEKPVPNPFPRGTIPTSGLEQLENDTERPSHSIVRLFLCC